MERVQIWDDLPGSPPSPEVQALMRVWFDEMVESGRLKVLTWETEFGSVTVISKGDALTDTEEN